MRSKPSEAPVFHLDAFSEKAQSVSFYIATLQNHLAEHHGLVDAPHKHDFYLMLLITSGSGTHTIDFVKYPVGAGDLFIMTPGQVHAWELSRETEGYILFFSPAFYALQSTTEERLQLPFFHTASATPRATLIGSTAKTISQLMSVLLEEFANEEQVNINILRAYLEIILQKVKGAFADLTPADHLNGAADKMRKLQQLIDKNFVKKRQPRDYADMMNLSASYLNTICKRNLDKTLTELIADRQILEAKRLFSYSNLNVSQVAARLSFNDDSYFIRFFRKHTGMTPDQFKQSINRPV